MYDYNCNQIIVGEAPSGRQFETFERCYRAYRDHHAATETAILGALDALYGAGFILGIISTGAFQRIRVILFHANLHRFFGVVEGDSKDKAVVSRPSRTPLVWMPALPFMWRSPGRLQSCVSGPREVHSGNDGSTQRTRFPSRYCCDGICCGSTELAFVYDLKCRGAHNTASTLVSAGVRRTQ
jgi:hypothetical protein